MNAGLAFWQHVLVFIAWWLGNTLELVRNSKTCCWDATPDWMYNVHWIHIDTFCQSVSVIASSRLLVFFLGQMLDREFQPWDAKKAFEKKFQNKLLLTLKQLGLWPTEVEKIRNDYIGAGYTRTRLHLPLYSNWIFSMRTEQN